MKNANGKKKVKGLGQGSQWNIGILRPQDAIIIIATIIMIIKKVMDNGSQPFKVFLREIKWKGWK